MLRRPRARRSGVAALLAVASVAAGCASNGAAPVPSGPVTVQVHDTAAGVTFDRRLLGTNVPAWIGPARLADPSFQHAVVSSGATVVRMPGGSWADGYDWLACENADPACGFTGPGRPSDYLGFLDATGLAGMWTVNVNETAQQAAALVAFFNGRTDDTHPIGTDRNGVDWQTVGHWAQLRADHGHPAPAAIDLWEIGNEIFGGKGDGEGDGDCASFAWEQSWTCDGAAYAAGDATHDGFVAISTAMKAVDPTVQVGAVGVADGSAWGSWGDEVMRGAGAAMDFYVLHQYAFSGRPSVSGTLRNPPSVWPKLLADVGRSVPSGGRRVPVAVTEYNLVAGQDSDDDRLMTKAVDALFIADSLGQMATQGVAIANQWNAINGKASNGTDYGMIDDAGHRAPQFYALALWSHYGTATVPATVSDTSTSRLAVYASTDAGGVVATILINKTASARDVQLADDTAATQAAATVATMAATTPDVTAVTWNGSPVGDETAAPALHDAGVVAMPYALTLPPWSITVVRLAPVPTASSTSASGT